MSGLLNSKWPKFARDEKNTGYFLNDYAGLDQLWSYGLNQQIEPGSPAIDVLGNIYIVAGHVGYTPTRVYKFSNAGAFLGSQTVASFGYSASQPTLGADGLLYIATQENQLCVIDPVDLSGNAYGFSGYGLGDGCISVNLDSIGDIYTGGWYSSRIDKATHTMTWFTHTGASYYNSMAIDEINGIVYAGGDNFSLGQAYRSRIYALDITDGGVLWYDESTTFHGAAAIDQDNLVIIPTGNSLRGYDYLGNLQWERADIPARACPAITNNRIYVGDISGYVWCLDLDGATIWTTGTGGLAIRSGILVCRNGIFAPTNTPYNLVVLSPSGGIVTTIGGGGLCGPAMANDGTLYLGSLYRSIIAIGQVGGCTINIGDQVCIKNGIITKSRSISPGDTVRVIYSNGMPIIQRSCPNVQAGDTVMKTSKGLIRKSL